MPKKRHQKVGPNAVIQLRAALINLVGPLDAARLFDRAGYIGLFRSPPEAMIDQTIAHDLFMQLFADLSAVDARHVAREAGTRTADYICANRIPRVVRWLLRRLPARLAGRILLAAILKHAWTFAGSGRCLRDRLPGLHGVTARLEIRDNPLSMPGGIWHAAVFERLYQNLVCPKVGVRAYDHRRARAHTTELLLTYGAAGKARVCDPAHLQALACITCKNPKKA